MKKRISEKILAMQERSIVLEKERLDFNSPKFFNGNNTVLLTEQAVQVIMMLKKLIKSSYGKYIRYGTDQAILIKNFDEKTGRITGDVHDIIHGKIQKNARVVGQEINYKNLLDDVLLSNIQI